MSFICIISPPILVIMFFMNYLLVFFGRKLVKIWRFLSEYIFKITAFETWSKNGCKLVLEFNVFLLISLNFSKLELKLSRRNYVVQHIIEMEIPTASTKMNAQFKGNYVNLSTQKFSSHVVQRCLEYVADSRSRIVREFLSDPHFEQLLQDPFANYVIQTALAFTKGSLHASLVEAVRQYKILRTSPYCKGIFSGSLLKK
ncbi:hypothetical protein Lalb_Chr11g0065451 [Lupinus albus]|uniref:PUM-HD domain-containing protein n=1 Tax=Lupinus albus TaxID=3870 RepID=A0A6A4PQS5_LUPAL|nr:hypothetical protein Lalb_Chr11g0065451 [Lupinus albus]